MNQNEKTQPIPVTGTHQSEGSGETFAKDPVCGMTINRAKAAGSHSHAAQTFTFAAQVAWRSSASILKKYFVGISAEAPRTSSHQGQPAETTKAPVEQAPCPMHPEVRQPRPGACLKCGMALEPVDVSLAPPTKTEYVCPMHPEIVRDEPGSCPICGMALEPRVATLEEDSNSELKDMTRRFWGSLFLSVPIFLISMSEMIPGQTLQQAVSGQALAWVQFTLSTPVVIWGGWPFFQRGWVSILNRSLNMFTLIAIGTGTAYFYSIIATLFPGLFPESFRGHGGGVSVYFEAAAVITTLVLLGQVLELKARSQTSSAIKALLGLAPKTARLLRQDGSEEDIALDRVVPGDRLRVRPGESARGWNGSGRKQLSGVESMITGESILVEKAVGSRVTGGTVNGTGSLVRFWPKE
ncbi:MAG: heavy metal-binding domain-containing protein [Terriglobia bacterium]